MNDGIPGNIGPTGPHGHEENEASSHLQAFDQVHAKPSPGESPDTPVLGHQARAS